MNTQIAVVARQRVIAAQSTSGQHQVLSIWPFRLTFRHFFDVNPLAMSRQSERAANLPRVQLAELRQWAARGERFAVATCYDATAARWLYRGGVRVLVVGDSAAQLVLGLEPGQSAPIDFMAAITGAVRRGAPNAFVIGDLPRESTEGSDDTALCHARRLVNAGADAVKIEVAEPDVPLVSALTRAGIAVVAHLRQDSSGARCTGNSSSPASLDGCAQTRLIQTGIAALSAGATILLLESLEREVTERVTKQLRTNNSQLVLLGCHTGPSCDGEVRVLHDLLGWSDAETTDPSGSPMGRQIQEIATTWVKSVRSG